MSNTTNPPPSREPTHPISKRLEHVRSHRGVSSRRKFWLQVVDGWNDENGDPRISYPAVKNYHFDREPPVSYLRRVADVFGVRIAWLVSGEGEMTEAEQAAAEQIEPHPTHVALAAFEKALWDRLGRPASERARAAVYDLWAELAAGYDNAGLAEQIDYDGERIARGTALSLTVADALLAPAVILPVDVPEDADVLDTCLVLVSEALRLYVRESRRESSPIPFSDALATALEEHRSADRADEFRARGRYLALLTGNDPDSTPDSEE